MQFVEIYIKRVLKSLEGVKNTRV